MYLNYSFLHTCKERNACASCLANSGCSLDLFFDVIGASILVHLRGLLKLKELVIPYVNSLVVFLLSGVLGDLFTVFFWWLGCIVVPLFYFCFLASAVGKLWWYESYGLACFKVV